MAFFIVPMARVRDPLSAFLFVIIIETLSRMVQAVVVGVFSLALRWETLMMVLSVCHIFL